MCGIAGIWSDNLGVPSAEIVSMIDTLTHRGPDSSGCAYLTARDGVTDIVVRDGGPGPNDREVALGHRRLSIIDLSASGAQPMTFGPLTISYNGEIYNYVELAEELAALGHRFKSRSDTEVLLHAWAEWGPDSLARLNGIFAFLLWDRSRKSLFAARDRFGVKPLYYFEEEGRIVFASEIKALLAVRKAAPRAAERLIYDFLMTGRLDHEDETMFAGIRRLPAGSWMTVGSHGCRIQKYWDLRPDAGSPCAKSLRESAEEFGRLFRDAIRLQMRSDVPVGSCLSGGLDSSAVVSIASRLGDRPMLTFTARFSDESMDEWSWAELIHRNSPVSAFSHVSDPRGFWRELPSLVRAQEEPFAGPGVYAQWCVMRLASEHGIRVVLDGQGGDELLCGYAKYFYWAIRDLLSRGHLLSSARSSVHVLLHPESFLFNWRAARKYVPVVGWVSAPGAGLLKREFAARHHHRRTVHPRGVTRAQQVLDINKFSLPVLLRYEDKNSMAHSVESRVPFLDHRLVEFCVGLPTEQKIRNGVSKLVMREALTGAVPAPILARRSKLGFGGDFRSWIGDLEDELSSWAADRARPVFRFVEAARVKALIAHRDPAVFGVVALDTWLDVFRVRG